jgi:hypothetical protein
MALPVSDMFPGSAGILPNPPWTQRGPANLYLRGDGTTDVDPSVTDVCMAIWNADVFPDDQVHSVVISGTLPGDDSVELGLVCRSDGGTFSGGTFYLAYTDNGSHTRLEKWVSGVATSLGSADSQAVVSGDTFEFECSGTTLTVRVNGTPVIVETDASIPSGQPGLYAISLVGTGVAGLSDWNGDGSGGTTSGTHVVTGRGSFVITSPAWLSTTITSRPGNLSNGAAEPPNWYHVGMISWGTANGAMTAYPVTRDLDLVEIPAGMDTLWYEFAAGLTATIIELASP